MRLRAAAGALFPLAGEEKKSKVEAECHRLDSVALAARARQRLQRALSCDRGSSREYRVQVRGGVSRYLITHQRLSREPRQRCPKSPKGPTLTATARRPPSRSPTAPGEYGSSVHTGHSLNCAAFRRG
jgi:hypothetical protein